MFLKRFIAVIAVLFSVFTLSYALDLKGTTESSSIDSKILGHAFKYKVYLPAEYTSQKQFPVIYLLHGSNGNENSWDELLGTLDTLISCEKFLRLQLLFHAAAIAGGLTEEKSMKVRL
ncbi:MAG TPA: alpha/beta hydrolase-fold protein [Petrotogaceae bacterium]|nr:alpha/beta hydrolase-fold protein [Petrotogaceae bacterium]